MTTYRVRATTHRAQVRVIGPTCDLSGPRPLSGAHAPSIPICASPTMKQPTSMWIFPHQQAEKSLQNQHVLSILQVGSHQLQYRFSRTKKPKSHHKTNTFCPITHKSPHNQHVMSLNPTNADRPGRPDTRRRHGHARSPGIPVESRGWERRRRDLNPRGAMHPYLLSREAHSTGLCDVSSADYFRAFLPRARTCARRDAHWRSARRRARDSNPRCHC